MSVTVQASKHPLKAEWAYADVEPGQSIYEIAGGAPVAAYINGREVPEAFHRLTQPKNGSTVILWPVPQDDNILRTAALVAVSIYAPQAAFALAGTTAATAGIGTYALAAGLAIAGNMAVNALIPPQQPEQTGTSESFNRLESITGTSNRVASFKPIPRLYGNFRFFPPIPMTARPYTEIVGDDQYFRMLLCLGYGPLNIGGRVVGEGMPVMQRFYESSRHSFSTSADWSKGTFNNTVLDGDSLTIADEADSGTWVSPELSIESLNVYEDSVVRLSSEESDVDDISCQVSLDGGATYLPENFAEEFSINRLSEVDDLQNISLVIRVNLTRGGFNQPSFLESLFVQIDGISVPKYDSKSLRIGETDLNLFEEVEYEIGTPDQISLYSDQILEDNPALNLNNSGDFGIRTTEPDIDEISIALTGRLFSINDKAKTRNGSVRFRIEYREVGASVWEIQNETWVISSSKKETVRQGYRWRVPKGQYEVRLTRKSSSFAADNNKTSDFTWNALRSIRSVQPFAVEDTVCMALRIKATDQLNGRIEDLSVLATSVLDVYDGSQWTKQATNNPAWVFADIWSGTANRQPVGKDGLDGDALLEWANYCDQEGLEYNGVFDSSGTTLDRAQEVAGAGLASWQFTPDSKISIVRDVVQSVPKMVISPRNSFGFNYELSVPQIPDALRVQFVDDRTWENTERLVFDDGFDETNAELYETLQAKGVTNPDQAWKYGRYHIAQQRLRPERYNFNQDVQHLRYQRGDLLTLQHDVIAVGLGAGRIKEVVSDTEIVVDEVFADQGITNYGVKIQHQDGSVSVVGCTLGSGPTNNTVFLNSAITKTNPDDLVIFGELGKESTDVKVTEIQPQGDFQAQITCVPAAPEIEQAWDGDIPAFDPVLTERVNPDSTTPRIPGISDIRSDESVLYADDDGSLKVRMVVSAGLTAFPGWDQKTQLRFRPVGDTSFETLEPTRSNSISVTDVDEGIEYEVQVRGVKDGIFSLWSSPVNHLVTGKTNPPPNVETLNAAQNGESVVFRWTDVAIPDLAGYELRYGVRGETDWRDAIKIAETNKGNVVTEVDAPPGDYTFFVKAIDTSGNYSKVAASKNLLVRTAYEALRTTEHHPNWDQGTTFGFNKLENFLIVDNDEDIAYYAAEPDDLGFDAKDIRVWAEVSFASSAVDTIIDLSEITASVTSLEDYGLLTGTGEETENYGSLLINVPVSDPRVNYQIAYRNTGELWKDEDAAILRNGSIIEAVNNQDDYGSISEESDTGLCYDMLMGWEDWTRGEIDARYIKQRVKFTRQDGSEGLRFLRKFKTVVDVGERIERAQALTVDPGGSTFQFDRKFNLRPIVTATVESDTDLFPIRKSLDTESVTYIVRDSDGNDVGTDNLDYIAVGV